MKNQETTLNRANTVTTTGQNALNSKVSDTLATLGNGSNGTAGNLNAVAYCRTARSGEANGISSQLNSIAHYVNKMGWTLTETYCDDGFNGNNGNRPDFKRLLRDIEDGRIDCVVVRDISRIGRDSKLLNSCIDFFVEHGVRFIAYVDGVDTVYGKDMALDLIIAMCGYYSRSISRLTKQAIHDGLVQGKFMNSQAPYGYAKSTTDKHLLVPDAPAAQIVQRIFAEFAASDSTRVIANRLNAECVDSPRTYQLRKTGKLGVSAFASWTTAAVLNILRNRVYTGDLVSGKSEADFKSGLRRTVTPENWIVVENTHVPVISRDLWDSVQVRLNAPKGGVARG